MFELERISHVLELQEKKRALKEEGKEKYEKSLAYHGGERGHSPNSPTSDIGGILFEEFPP